jgi:predicted regulator of Ras-like GTPase activity (Roadblock/LC7/MglB family)
MGLTDILYDTIDRIQDAQLAGVIGTDGLSVEMVLLDGDLPHSQDEAEMELSRLIMAAADTAARLSGGMANDLILETDYATYLVSYVAPGYYAVLGVNPGGSLGRARFALRQMVGIMLEEL